MNFLNLGKTLEDVSVYLTNGETYPLGKMIIDRIKKEVKIYNQSKENNLTRYWIALYSASGKEILEISKRIGRFPDRIITNQKDISKTIPELLAVCEKENIDFVQIPTNLTITDYNELFLPESLISLHGWSRIIPAEVCENFEILNIHPGNTTDRCIEEKIEKKYIKIIPISIIIGKDPQRKALEDRVEYTGVTIHKCSSKLDCGEVIAFKEVKNNYINEFLTEEILNKFINELREVSIKLWLPVLRKYLYVNYSSIVET